MKRLFFTAILFLASACFAVVADDDIFDMSFEQNVAPLNVYGLTDKQHNRIIAFQKSVANSLAEHYSTVETMNDGEVVIVTILAKDLFEPNGKKLTKGGKKRLLEVSKLLRNPGFYKFIIAMHTDGNTGNKAYANQISLERINQIDEWFQEEGEYKHSEFVVPYTLSDTDPIYDNTTMEGRDKNRRLEIYIVPHTVMIEQARQGKVNINKTK